MTPRISLLLPSRGRPEGIQRLFRSIEEMTSNPAAVEVILRLDEDDPSSRGITSDVFHVHEIVGPRVSMGEYNTACMKAARGDILVCANDDMLVRTPAWDQLLIDFHEGIPDGVYLAYGNDLIKGRGLCTFPIMSRRTCETLSAPFPATYAGQLIDYHLMDLFKRLEKAGWSRTFYLDELVFEHLHYRVGKSQFDETYKQRCRFGDDGNFAHLCRFRQEEAARLLALLAHQPLPQQPDEPSNRGENPPGLLVALWRYFTAFVLDGGLPMRWKSFLFAFFVARFLRSKGYLGWLDKRPGLAKVATAG